MKKVFTTCLLIFSCFLIFSQQINKEFVVVEIGTGTWCQYCPGAAMGADDLIENGHLVAVIENHNGDPFANDDSNTRNSYYNISGYPTAVFNGQNAIVGGDHNISMYPNYLPVYNSAIAVLTSFSLSAELIPVNDFTFDVIITIDKVHDYTDTNLVAQLALTESHIEESWQGMEELNFVNRKMFPSASGTNLDFSSTNQEILYYTLTLDNEWELDNCEIVAFIQDNDSKEILQATKMSLNIPIGENNVMLKEINYPTEGSKICENPISPIITVKNRGSEDLLSFNAEYEINGEGVQTVNWAGNLAYGETTEIVLDEIVYTSMSNNTLSVNLTTPNNTTDDDLSNNSFSVNFDKSLETTTRTFLEINPAGSFGLSWILTNSEGTQVYSGNISGVDIVNEIFDLNFNECYVFTFSSLMGNGIPDGGYFILTDSEDNEIYYGANDSFSDEVIIPLKVAAISGISENVNNEISVFPNPAVDQIFIESEKSSFRYIHVLNLSGSTVYSILPEKNKTKIKINTRSLSSGIYFVNIYTDTETITKKISVVK